MALTLILGAHNTVIKTINLIKKKTFHQLIICRWTVVEAIINGSYSTIIESYNQGNIFKGYQLGRPLDRPLELNHGPHLDNHNL